MRISFLNFVADFNVDKRRGTTARFSFGQLAVHECIFCRADDNSLYSEVFPVLAFDQSLRPPSSHGGGGASRDTDINGLPFAARQYPMWDRHSGGGGGGSANPGGEDHLDHPTADLSVSMRLPSSRNKTTSLSVVLRPTVFSLDVTLLDRMYWYLNLDPAGEQMTESIYQPLERVGLVAVAPEEVLLLHSSASFLVNCSFVRLVLLAPVADFRADVLSSQVAQPHDRPSKPSMRPSALWMDFVGVAIENANALDVGSPIPGRSSGVGSRARRRLDRQPPRGNELPLHRQFGFKISFSQLCGYIVPHVTADAIGFLNINSNDHLPALSIAIEGRKEPLRSPHVFHSRSSNVRDSDRMRSQEEPPFHGTSTGPFSAKFVAREGRERSMHPATFAEVEEYWRPFVRRAEYQVDVALGFVHCHLRQDNYGRLYSHLMDISMWEPWKPTNLEAEIAEPVSRESHPGIARDFDDISLRTASASTATGVGPRFAAGINMAAAATVNLRLGGHNVLPHLLGLSLTMSKANVVLEETTDYRLRRSDQDKTKKAAADAEFTHRFHFGLEDFTMFCGVGVHGTHLKHISIYSRRLVMSEADGLDGLQRSCLKAQAGSSGHMLAVAVSIDVNTAFATPLKVLTVAVDVDSALLKHRMSLPGQHWIFRLMDFVDVADPEWEGYVAADRMMKVHLRLLDVLLLYLPHGVPESALLSVEALHFNANIVPQSSVSVLSLTFDGFRCLLLPNQVPFTDEADSEGRSLKSLPWVQVVHDPELAVVLRTCSDGSRPGIEIEVTNHDLLMETCSDSFSSFASILGHYFRGGDLAAAMSAPAPDVFCEDGEERVVAEGEVAADGNPLTGDSFAVETPNSSWGGMADSSETSGLLMSPVSHTEGLFQPASVSNSSEPSPEGEDDVFQSALEPYWSLSSDGSGNDVARAADDSQSRCSTQHSTFNMTLVVPTPRAASERSADTIATTSSSDTAAGLDEQRLNADAFASLSSTPTPGIMGPLPLHLPGASTPTWSTAAADNSLHLSTAPKAGAPIKPSGGGGFARQVSVDSTAADLLDALQDMELEAPQAMLLLAGEALSFVEDHFVREHAPAHVHLPTHVPLPILPLIGGLPIPSSLGLC